MSSNLKTRLSNQAISDLTHLSSLLHLLHHRNYNQHRRSSWYRHFSIFRRQLSKLLASYTELARIPDTHLGKHRKKAQDVQTTKEITQRLEFWADVLVPKSQHAFSQLAADGRFAVTGVVLLAILAQFCGLVGVTVMYEEMGQLEMERVLKQFADEEWGGEKHAFGRGGESMEIEDLGQVLARDEVVQDSSSKTVAKEVTAVDVEDGVEREKPFLDDEPEPAVPLPATVLPAVIQPPEEEPLPNKNKRDRKPSSKKKRKRDAIDDLFSGI